MKEFLSREGIEFDVRNVEEDDGAYRDLMALGIRAVPVTVAGDTIIRGFDPPRLRQAIASLRAQS